jgi:hypothetical protein
MDNRIYSIYNNDCYHIIIVIGVGTVSIDWKRRETAATETIGTICKETISTKEDLISEAIL